jgi:hypothetical protein
MPDFGTADSSSKDSKISADKTEKISIPSSTFKNETLKKPFPWPFFLSLLLPASFLGLLYWELNQGTYIATVRMGWDCLNSFVPGIAFMILVGSIVQFRKRPLLSAISFVASLCFMAFSYWTVQRLIETHWLN